MSDPADPLATPDQPDEGDRRYPSTIGGAFYLAILAAAVVAIAIVMTSDWRVGVRVLAGALGAAGAGRLLLPQRDAGMLAVRHRLVDVAILVGVAVTLWWLAGSIPNQPG